MSDEEFNAIGTVAKFKYYKQYVEPLEKEFDEMQEQNRLLKMENTLLKNKIKDMKREVTQEEFKRIRNQNVKLYEKIKRLEMVIEKLRR